MPLKFRLLIVLMVIVAAPMVLLAALGSIMARDEAAIVQNRFEELLRGQLNDIRSQFDRILEERQVRLRRLLDGLATGPEALRDLARREPLLTQCFVLDAQGVMIFPDATAPISAGELEFLGRVQPVLRRGELGAAIRNLHREGMNEDRGVFVIPPIKKTAITLAQGWQSWYWDHGTQLLYWRELPQGGAVGAELDRARLMADCIAALPATDPSAPTLPEGRIRLRDANGEVLYQWGSYDAPEDAPPAVSVNLNAPLAAWSLDYLIEPAFLAPGRSQWLNWLALLVACAGLVVLLAVVFYRESSRDLREASQRVNFVNKVSHELKTPLTNIRMYAELMKERLAAEDDPRSVQYLDVIVEESQRLSRLIGNVLTFGHSQRGALMLHVTECEPDAIIGAVVEQFRPSLEARGMTIELNLQAAGPMGMDRDLTGQLLGNLLGNVEKYAGEGSRVRIASRREQDRLIVTVADTGPGIAPAEAEKIFRPFYRINDSLSEGVSGTGIGLTIARELARLHDGDLRLCPAAQGACFELTLRERKGAPRA